MKAFKFVMVVLIALCCILPTFAVNEAQATVWAFCWVNQTGQSDVKYIQLTDYTGTKPEINGTWYVLSDAYGGSNQLLATALTAMASCMKVQVGLTDTAPYQSVTAIYLMDK